MTPIFILVCQGQMNSAFQSCNSVKHSSMYLTLTMYTVLLLPAKSTQMLLLDVVTLNFKEIWTVLLPEALTDKSSANYDSNIRCCCIYHG